MGARSWGKGTITFRLQRFGDLGFSEALDPLLYSLGRTDVLLFLSAIDSTS